MCYSYCSFSKNSYSWGSGVVATSINKILLCKAFGWMNWNKKNKKID
jgi:hypothetical protein